MYNMYNMYMYMYMYVYIYNAYHEADFRRSQVLVVHDPFRSAPSRHVPKVMLDERGYGKLCDMGWPAEKRQSLGW